MQKTDFKKYLKSLYVLGAKHCAIVDVPKMNFINIDGAGIPEGLAFAEAVSWLYSISYPLKFLSKQILQKDYVFPPLERLWCADDMCAYTEGRKEDWLWSMMIMQPD